LASYFLAIFPGQNPLVIKANMDKFENLWYRK